MKDQIFDKGQIVWYTGPDLVAYETGKTYTVLGYNKKLDMYGILSYLDDEVFMLPEDVNADFVLKCQGDSMIDANIQDGDLVFIEESPIVENGEIAAVVIGEEATLKKVYYQNDTITLLPANSAYAPMVYHKEEINNIRICGKAVAVLRHI